MLYAWCDLETTGLDENLCSICEIACIITDDHWNEEREIYHQIIDSREAYWQPVALAMHQASGLYDEMENKPIEEEALICFREWLIDVYAQEETRFVLSGSSVHFDRKFLTKKWPQPRDDFENLFSHRNLDVSSIKVALRAIWGDVVANSYTNQEQKEVDHRALKDIRHSIGQLLHFKNKGLLGDK